MNNSINSNNNNIYSLNLNSIENYVNFAIDELFNGFIEEINNFVKPEEYSKNITTKQLEKLEKGYSTKTCSICLETNNESVRLPCGHFYHENCIKTWLTKKSLCPLCKYDCSKI
jgi:hypothetical protein